MSPASDRRELSGCVFRIVRAVCVECRGLRVRMRRDCWTEQSVSQVWGHKDSTSLYPDSQVQQFQEPQGVSPLVEVPISGTGARSDTRAVLSGVVGNPLSESGSIID